jgi:hypothetical protein
MSQLGSEMSAAMSILISTNAAACASLLRVPLSLFLSALGAIRFGMGRSGGVIYIVKRVVM